MRICIIAEGSYPYVTGGVSSWIQSVITQMPEHEFIIYAISPEKKQRGQFKYELPDNLVEVKESFLDSYLEEKVKWGKSFKMTIGEKRNVKSLLGSEGEMDWPAFIRMVRSPRFSNVSDFLTSRDFYDILHELCEEHYPLVPFTEMFWTVRSMILPLLIIIRDDIPKADLYHGVSTGYAGIIGTVANEVHGKPFLLTEHGIYSREREEEIIKADWVKGYFKDLWIQYFYRLSSSAYNHSDWVTTLFGRNKEVEVELGCAEEKIEIIPNGVSVVDYKRLPSTKPENEFYIGAIVRVVPIKDIKTMLQSFALIKQKLPNAVFYILGPYEENEDYYEECLQLVEVLELKDVFFTGLVPIREYIGKMDLLVLSSISEGQPLAILEGMAAGKPFVATDVGSCRELLEGIDDGIGPSGIVVPVMHYEQMANAAIKLYKDEALRLEMARNAYKRVERYYRQDDVIKNYRRLYESMGGGHDGGHRI
ncbi:GT4 family glycosyltransferase PelF [Sporosarcina oncorhynchi]|uniref:GT4 family glycosyltransferase PelF n=1 Tax=Sporosarcina oncorhynchi TaxID=3056444 RepID=A0ABZ0L2I8_9BACL|nr:GT4 family glycosyltransferase PelF [Sporosarcina sp. T2O-4]WOV86827.1 GT4 family glycosyltransferase PelF [Sporosarcina sp. T2O-4]